MVFVNSNHLIWQGNGSADLPGRIEDWNSQLPSYVSSFAASHPNITTALYDSHALFTMVLNDPKKYGFKDAVSSCNFSTCIWSDGLHSTFAMHKILAADLTNFLGNTDHSLTSANSGASRTSSHPLTLFILSMIVAFIGGAVLSGTVGF